jgi:hypothetical protein
MTELLYSNSLRGTTFTVDDFSPEEAEWLLTKQADIQQLLAGTPFKLSSWDDFGYMIVPGYHRVGEAFMDMLRKFKEETQPMFEFRPTILNPMWDYFLTISHTKTALIAYRKDINNNQHYLGLVFRLTGGYGAVSVPKSCHGGCTCGGTGAKCISKDKKQEVFKTAQEAVDFVFKSAGMNGPLPQDLIEPPCFKEYDKNKALMGGRWNGQIIYGNLPVAEQTSVEPVYSGKKVAERTVHYQQRPKPGSRQRHVEHDRIPSYRPAPKAESKKRRDEVEVQSAPRKALSIEEALDDAMGDLKKEFGFDASDS